MIVNRILRMKHIAGIVGLFGLLLVSSVTCYAQPKDVFGWRDARWEMSEKDIVKVFGAKLKQLPERKVFLGMHVDYVIPEFELESNLYTVFFQMDDVTNKLRQVLIRLNEQESPSPRAQVFNVLAPLLTHEYGEPSDKREHRYTFLGKFNGVELSQTWKFSTTTIELSYGWDSQIYASLLTIRYFPSKKDNSVRRLTTVGTRRPFSVPLMYVE